MGSVMGQPKFYLLILAIILFGSWIAFNSGPAVIETNVSNEALNTTSTPDIKPTAVPSQVVVSKPSSNTNTDTSGDATATTPKEVRHIDMLSDEMKQSIRDKLFHHGPKDTIERDDGITILPANGRFTQMPVAVQMPDGSIKIQEYSVLPE